MDDNEKIEYMERLAEVIQECLTTHEATKHALLIVANDDTEAISLYAINADEKILPPLMKAASQIVTVHTETGADRVLN